MQTFLPYPSGVKSARVLDRQRLGKQRVECLQILAALTDIYKSQADYRLLELTPGTVSMAPMTFCTHSGDVWVWNPNMSGAGWTKHPAVAMWRGYEAALVQYSLEICGEWLKRGYRDTTAQTISLMADLSIQVVAQGRSKRGVSPTTLEHPPWWGDEALHTSHQSNLLRKDGEHYGKFFPEVDPGLEYIWPTKAGGATPPRAGRG